MADSGEEINSVLCSSGGSVPTAGRDADGGRLQQALDEAQGDDRLVLAGSEQFWRGGVGPLGRHATSAGRADLPLARPRRLISS